jgi:AcrR family transcriptional regulator
MCSASALADNPRPQRDAAALRIRDVALRLFGEQGYDGTSVRTIAQVAGVSPALVIHHYGSKERLRHACDTYALEVTRSTFAELLRSFPATDGSVDRDLNSMLVDPVSTVLTYVARAMTDGTVAGDTLMDEVVDVARSGLEQAAAAGSVRPSDDPQMRAVLLTLYDLVPLLLARHVTRLTGSDPRTPDGYTRLARVALELSLHPLAPAKEHRP